jgi:hypothetical protein
MVVRERDQWPEHACNQSSDPVSAGAAVPVDRGFAAGLSLAGPTAASQSPPRRPRPRPHPPHNAHLHAGKWGRGGGPKSISCCCRPDASSVTRVMAPQLPVKGGVVRLCCRQPAGEKTQWLPAAMSVGCVHAQKSLKILNSEWLWKIIHDLETTAEHLDAGSSEAFVGNFPRVHCV